MHSCHKNVEFDFVKQQVFFVKEKNEDEMENQRKVSFITIYFHHLKNLLILGVLSSLLYDFKH